MSSDHPIDTISKMIILIFVLFIMGYMLFLAFGVNVIPDFVSVFS